MAHRVLGTIAAVLFALFVVGGVVAFVEALPHTSCAGVTPTHYSGDTVKLAGPGWTNISARDCVEVISQSVASANSLPVGNGYDLGSAPTSHEGTLWTDYREGVGAWIAWTAAMCLLAAAVAAIPGRPQPVDGSVGWTGPPTLPPVPTAAGPIAPTTDLDPRPADPSGLTMTS